jgi:signal transduction histidine kinase
VSEQQTEFLSFCLEDVDRLTRLINDLLDISRLEAKKTEINKEAFDIVGIVKGVHSSFISRVAAKGLELRTNFSKEKIQVYADRDKLIQVFTNLVGNSLKFTERGFIEISVIEKADVIVCSVRDTGKGISEADVPKTFSKFQQFGRTDDAGEKGTGLGLAISKGIVELHGGKIWVESKLNEGSQFSFILPAQIPRLAV